MSRSVDCGNGIGCPKRKSFEVPVGLHSRVGTDMCVCIPDVRVPEVTTSKSLRDICTLKVIKENIRKTK